MQSENIDNMHPTGPHRDCRACSTIIEMLVELHSSNQTDGQCTTKLQVRTRIALLHTCSVPSVHMLLKDSTITVLIESTA